MKKKLFVSVPMRGREEKDILDSIHRMHEIAEAIFGCELEVIDSYIDAPVLVDDDRKSIYYLGHSIVRMAEADYFIGVNESWRYRGCSAEREIAARYEIPMFIIHSEYVMSDWKKILEEEERAYSCTMEARCD